MGCPTNSTIGIIRESVNQHPLPAIRDLHNTLDVLCQARARAQFLYNATTLVYRTPGADTKTLMQMQFRDEYDRVRMISEPGLAQLVTWEEKKSQAMEQLNQKPPSGIIAGVPLCPGVKTPGKSSTEKTRESPATPPTARKPQSAGQAKRGKARGGRGNSSGQSRPNYSSRDSDRGGGADNSKRDREYDRSDRDYKSGRDHQRDRGEYDKKGKDRDGRH